VTPCHEVPALAGIWQDENTCVSLTKPLAELSQAQVTVVSEQDPKDETKEVKHLEIMWASDEICEE
jgi:hypothetical protein